MASNHRAVEARVRVEYRDRFAQEYVIGKFSLKQALAEACKRTLAKWKRISYFGDKGAQSVVVRATLAQVSPQGIEQQHQVELTLFARDAGDKSITRTHRNYGYLNMPLELTAMLDEFARAVRAEADSRRD